MANTLQEVVTATALASGATLPIAHHLNLNGDNLIPDRVFRDNDAFTIVACTDTTLTVRNDGVGAQTGNFRLEYDHTIERVYGNSAVKQLVPAPFIPGGAAGGGGGGGAVQAFTYTCTGAEGSDFTIALPATRPDVDYIPQVTCGGVTAILTFDCPNADRTTTQFRVIASAAVQAGDPLDVVATQRT